jgi:sugar phosphate isomerase/epimerase
MRNSPPKLALCNFITNTKALREFALDHKFDGIDWTFTTQNFPRSPHEEFDLRTKISGMYPLEVRYHCFFPMMDVGSAREEEALSAMRLFRSVCRLVSPLRGRFITIHVGLGRDSTSDLSWETTLLGLSELAAFAGRFGLRVCIENLARGWTSRPYLFEKLLRKSALWGTLDIGHARVCASVKTQCNTVEDFVQPHRERVLNAHVYHEETTEGHLPPSQIEDIAPRLSLLRSLPACDWWVLELREETALLRTLAIVRSFLNECTETAFSNDLGRPRMQLGPQELLRAAG